MSGPPLVAAKAAANHFVELVLGGALEPMVGDERSGAEASSRIALVPQQGLASAPAK